MSGHTIFRMPHRRVLVPVDQIASAIHIVRGRRVMLDADLAVLYGVSRAA